MDSHEPSLAQDATKVRRFWSVLHAAAFGADAYGLVFLVLILLFKPAGLFASNR